MELFYTYLLTLMNFKVMMHSEYSYCIQIDLVLSLSIYIIDMVLKSIYLLTDWTTLIGKCVQDA